MRTTTLLRARRTNPRQTHPTPRRLLLEKLEDRVVPSLPADGTILAASGPSAFSNVDQSFSLIGIIGVDPTSGSQSPLSTGGNFVLPTYTAQAPTSQATLYISDLYAFPSFELKSVANSGTSTGSNTNDTFNNTSTFNDTSKSWSADQWTGFEVEITGGKGAGQNRTVLLNSSNQLTVAPAWNTIPDATSTYQIGQAQVLGAIIAVDPSSGQQTVVARGTMTGSDGKNHPDPNSFINGPNAVLFINNALYIANEGYADGTVHYIDRLNLSTGQQQILTNPNTTSSTGFTVPTGMGYRGNTIYVADEPQNVSGTNPGQVWAVNSSTGSQTLLSSNNNAQGFLFNHPVDLTMEASGNLLVLNTGSGGFGGSIIRVNAQTGIQSTVSSFVGSDRGGLDGLDVSSTDTAYVGSLSYGSTPGRVYSVDATQVTSSQTVLSENGQLNEVEGVRIFHLPVQSGATTTTSLVSSLNPSQYGQSVTFTATVSSSAQGTPTGMVTFTDGSTTLGTVSLTGSTASLSTSSLTRGTHSITASYSGDSNFQGSASTPVVQTVNQTNSTAMLSSSFNPSVTGQLVTFTLTVTGGGPSNPTGTVTFMNGSATLGTRTLNSSGQASLSTSLAQGSYTITASYGGDNNYLGSSDMLTQTVNQANTSTAISSSPNPSTAGQTVTFTATVSVTGPGSTSAVGLTGMVTFMDGSSTLGTAPVNSAGQATFNTALGQGNHSITASYSGDNNFQGSTSATLTQTVSQATTNTTTTVSSSDNPSVSGETVTFTATVTASGSSNPTSGTVTFMDGSSTLGTGSLNSSGQATFSVALARGNHSITATYGGSGAFQGSTSATLTQTVNQAMTSTAVGSSPNPTVTGQTVTFTATVSVTGLGSTAAASLSGTVTFMDGSSTLGTAPVNSSGQATFSISLAQGDHAITASYGGNNNFQGSTSATLTQTVNQANTSTAISSSPNPSTAGQTVTFTATVSVTGPGSTSAVGLTGMVTFMDGSSTLGTAPVNSVGQATFNTALDQGTHSITAAYSGDTNFQGSTSPTLTQTVSQAATSTTTTVSSSPNPSVTGQTVTFTATVTASGGNPTSGTVTFMDGSATLGTASLNSSSQATFSTSLAQGSHSITATYGGSGSFEGSTSPTLTQTVNQAMTSTAVSSAPNPSSANQTVTFTATVSVTAPGSTSAVGLTGTVTFKDGSSTLGTAPVNSAGQATFSTALAQGSHTITASYGGDNNFQGSTSGTLTQTVTAVTSTATTTTVSSSLNPSFVGESVTFTATITPQSGSGSPAGTVQFNIDGSNAGSPVNVIGGTASYTTPSLTAGTHTVTATYSGDANFNSSIGGLVGGQLVNSPSEYATSTTTVTSSVNPSAFGQTVTFTASVNGGFYGAPNGTVTFFDGFTNIGSATLSGFGSTTTGSITTSSLTAGSHLITASYGGGYPFRGSTGTLTQTVTSGSAATTTTLVSSTNPSLFGQSVTFTATVTGSGATPTGSVTFTDGSTTLGTASLNSGMATFSISTLAGGSHTITASYGGSGSYQGSTSAPLTQTVNPISSTTMVSSSANPSAAGQTVTFTATVTGSGPSNPTGTVTFTEGSTTLGSGTLNSTGQATFSISTLPAGNHTITASYGGDNNYRSSNTTLTQTVTTTASTATMTAVSSSPNPSVTGQTVTFMATVTASGSSNPTSGTVTFMDGSSTLGTASLNSAGQATFSIALAQGNHSITASYGGNSSFQGSTSAALTQTVNQANTSTALSSLPNPSSSGQTVTFTATVSVTAPGSTAAASPTGTVTFKDGASTLGTAPVNSAGQATFTISNLGVGNHSITASYGGDNNFVGSTSATLTQTVNTGSTSTVIEDFEHGLGLYNSVGFTNARTVTYAAHDGSFGLDMGSSTGWIYRSDTGAQVHQGETLSVWVKIPSFITGRAYFGFGASSGGTLSAALDAGARQLILQDNTGFGSNTLASVSQTFVANTWYRLEVAWGMGGSITGRVYDSSGTNLLNSVQATDNNITAGGIAFAATSYDKYFDTVTVRQGTGSGGAAGSGPAIKAPTVAGSSSADAVGLTAPMVAPTGSVAPSPTLGTLSESSMPVAIPALALLSDPARPNQNGEWAAAIAGLPERLAVDAYFAELKVID